jgi:exopolyphosphatase/guanosine-5'-triphosphate,3'-diphosphate pyrophosphatase
MRAVVDIGSNSVKFSLAEVRRGMPMLVRKRSWITRLGRGLEQTGRLAPEAVSETTQALREIAAELAPYRSGLDLIAVATSAVRDCANPEEVAGPVEQILGIRLQILTGIEEARYSMRGAAEAARVFFGSKKAALVDVGGSSTEVGIVEPEFAACSFRAGAVRCHEGLGFAAMPVNDSLWLAAQSGVRKYFPDDQWGPLTAQFPKGLDRAVAVGGSLLAAANLAGAKSALMASGESLGYITTRSTLEAFNDRFRKLTLDERMAFPRMERGRADILCAGLLCLTSVLERLGIDEVLISDWGLRQGLLLTT